MEVNENTAYKNLEDTAKAVFRQNFVEINASVRKRKILNKPPP